MTTADAPIFDPAVHVVETGIVIPKRELLEKAVAFFEARLPGVRVKEMPDGRGYCFTWQVMGEAPETDARIAQLETAFREASL